MTKKNEKLSKSIRQYELLILLFITIAVLLLFVVFAIKNIAIMFFLTVASLFLAVMVIIYSSVIVSLIKQMQ